MPSNPEYRKGMHYLTRREEELVRVAVETAVNRAKQDAEDSILPEDREAEMKFFGELSQLQRKFPPLDDGVSLAV